MAKSRNRYNGLARKEELTETPEILEEPVILEESFVPEEPIIEEVKEAIIEKPEVKIEKSQKKVGIIKAVLEKKGLLIIETPDGFGYSIQGTGKVGDTIEF